MNCYCPKCSAQNPDTARFCSVCGSSLAAGGTAAAPAAPAVAATPTENSGKATASLVLGILGFVTCGIAGIVAIVLGATAQRDIGGSGGRLGGGGRAIAGMILGGASVILMPIALLTAIAVPNFLEAQNRAKVARTLSDMRTMEIGIEAYHVDCGSYPATLGQATTPTPYIVPIPRDVFAKSAGPGGMKPSLVYAPFQKEIRNGQTGYHAYLILGRGPDGNLDIDPARDLPPGPFMNVQEARRRLAAKAYDATNGTVSEGDVFRIGGD